MKTLRIMKNQILSVRVNAENPNHNLWLNNGTWCVAYTVRLPDGTPKRIRRSVGTKDVRVARHRRDAVFRRHQATEDECPPPGNHIRVSPFTSTEFTIPVMAAEVTGPSLEPKADSMSVRRLSNPPGMELNPQRAA